MINIKGIMDLTKLKKEIITHEGYKNEVYLDHLGNPTVGVGHLVRDNEPWQVGDKLDFKTIDKIFEYDVSIAVKDAQEWLGKEVPEECLLVICNMSFQLGRNRLGGFKKLKSAILDSNWKLASEEMLDSKWAKQTPHRANELSRRMSNVR